MNEIRDGGKEGFRTKMTQERRETGKEGSGLKLQHVKQKRRWRGGIQ